LADPDGPGIVREAYTCNIHVVNAAGNDLEDVTVTCTSQEGQEFSVQTGADGTIAEQELVYKKWSGTAATETAYSPHTFTFSKEGFGTLILADVTVDRPIRWRVPLQVPSSSGARRGPLYIGPMP